MNNSIVELINNGITFWMRSDEYYTIRDVSRLLHISPDTVKELANRDDDPLPMRIFPDKQRGAFIHKDDLREWISRSTILLRDASTSEYKRKRN